MSTVTITELTQNVTVEETTQNITVSGASSFPITIEYNATVVEGGQGAPGQDGADGDPGVGVPVGGTAGQILTKVDSTDYNTTWAAAPVTGLQNVVEDTTPELGGNLVLGSNSIVASAATAGTTYIKSGQTNGIDIATDKDISILTSQATGNVYISTTGSGPTSAVYVPGTKFYTSSIAPTTGAVISSSSPAGLNLTTNSGTNAGYIRLNPGANTNIEVAPNGTGDVLLTADTVRLGDANATATLTTNGTGNLTLNTNSGSNSGNITISAGANGNISIAPNGTGIISTTGHIIPSANIAYDLGSATNRFRTLYLSGNTIDLGGTTISAVDGGLVVESDQQLKAIASTDYVDEVFSTAITTVSESQPQIAVIGEQWFNPTTQILSVYTATGWVQVSADDLQF